MKDRLWSSNGKSHSANMHMLPDPPTQANTHLMINYEKRFQQQQGYNLEVKGTLPPGKDLKTDAYGRVHTCTYITDTVPVRAKRSSL